MIIDVQEHPSGHNVVVFGTTRQISNSLGDILSHAILAQRLNEVSEWCTQQFGEPDGRRWERLSRFEYHFRHGADVLLLKMMWGGE